ncbi:MAG: cyclic pyranopterin monophosphate synthase MoaC [Bacteroidota bacterium]
MSDDLSHINEKGMAAMVDVSPKAVTKRVARARAKVELPANVLEAFEANDIQSKKGPVFQTAILAGIMGAKKTGDLIPLCHPLGLDNCDLEISINNEQLVIIDCTASIESKTGVEMEALTGATVAALTIYDMCKAMSHDIIIKEIKLMEKSGGKRDFKRK